MQFSGCMKKICAKAPGERFCRMRWSGSIRMRTGNGHGNGSFLHRADILKQKLELSADAISMSPRFSVFSSAPSEGAALPNLRHLTVCGTIYPSGVCRAMSEVIRTRFGIAGRSGDETCAIARHSFGDRYRLFRKPRRASPGCIGLVGRGGMSSWQAPFSFMRVWLPDISNVQQHISFTATYSIVVGAVFTVPSIKSLLLRPTGRFRLQG